MEELKRCLSIGSLLIHSEKGGPAPNLRAVLITRLAQYRAQRGLPECDCDDYSLEQAQEETAQEALSVVEGVQRILDQDASDVSSQSKEGEPGEVPLIGTRDISQLRTLLSIVFKWGTEPLLAHVQVVWPTRGSTAGSKLLDVDDAPQSFAKLTTMTRQLLSLLFPRGVHGTVPQTLITSTLLNRHITDLLRPGIALGWVPKALSTESFPVVDDLRPLIMRMMSILPPSQTIASLGTILSSSSPPPQHVHKSCASLLSRQLMRPDGVRGLFAAVFGENESEEAPLEKLLHVAQVLGVVPSVVTAEEYFRSVIPRLIELLTPRAKASPAYIRAASFTLSRMITAEGSPRHHTLVSRTLFNLLHDPVLLITPDSQSTEAITACSLSPLEAIDVVQTFLTNTDPAPTLVSTTLSPIATSMYALLGALACVRTADPTLRESVHGLLLTWGRVVPVEEAVAILWACIDGQGGDWTVDISGSVRRVEKQEKKSLLAFFTPHDLEEAEESGALDADANFLDLRPDPTHFVDFLVSLDRPDVTSDVFVRLLEGYRDLKANKESDPLRTLLFLQLIVQVQSRMSRDDSSSNNILSKPEHVLTFIKHALQSDTVQDTAPKQASVDPSPRQGLTRDDLRIVSEDDPDEDNDTEADSDDETSGLQGARPNDEMNITALNLLLSILEANPTLSSQLAPILEEILKHAERLAKAPSESVRALSREARMVLTVHLASASSASPGPAREPEEDRIRSTYQRALKLLRDPLLPVRAHGLLLLRELVTAHAGTTPHEAVRALEPAIRDVFMQAVQDDDSYIFLNAVQGMAALANSFGADVLRALVRGYADGLQGVGVGALIQQDIDIRLRIGEALGQVIRRCGDTLPRHSDSLIPPLFALVRGSYLPTTLRTSALSLLATIADTADLALLPYAHDIAHSMLDLLQIEGARGSEQTQEGQQHPVSTNTDANFSSISPSQQLPIPSMDNQPTAANPTFPPFRRASLHFLGILVCAYTRRAYAISDSSVGGSGMSADDFPTRRAATTLAYIAATDADAVVRVMAGEVGDAVHTLERALVGL